MPRNARKNRPFHAHLMSDNTPSPPAHLPTPLPELATPVPLLAQEPLAASTVLDHLIDFDQPEEEQRHVQYMYPLDSQDDADLGVYYRSPPFREAQLPPTDEYRQPRIETPPPLPIPPRIHQQYFEDTETLGHTRTPTLPRSPTRLESISRTIKTYAPPTSAFKSSASAALRSSAGALRTYVPSSIHIPVPSAGPSPPLVSRPVSFGRFSVDPELSRQEQCLDHSFDYPQEAFTDGGLAPYPRSEDALADPIAWAYWDMLSQRRVLIIGYTSGIQIWDCHDLGSVTEILNLRLSSEDWALDIAGRPVNFSIFAHAGVLPAPPRAPGDMLAIHRPLLGILMTAANGGHSAFFVYSLKTHQLVQRLALAGVASTFESNMNFIVISTTLPSAVHIFFATTFQLLWTIDSASLAPFSPSSSLLLNVSLVSSPIDPAPPRPVFALSHRLLAYASPRPYQDRRVSLSSTTASGTSSVSSSPFGFTQSDIGSAALKVGGTVLSGMKFLGGIAYEAAKTRIADAGGPGGGGGGGGAVGGGQGTGNRFFSRSAPTDERPFTSTASSPADKDKDKIVTPHPNPVVESGYYVTVLDLAPLGHHDGIGGGMPAKIAEFRVSQSQPVARLAFSHDGCQLITVPETGRVIKVFEILPAAGEVLKDGLVGGSSLHMYDLKRGRTSVLVEGLDCTRDGRWLAIGTRNRTLHVFAINPYGGKPDIASHFEGRVKNVDELQPSRVEVNPVVRLRPMHSPKPGQLRAPLAFVFVRPGDVHLPSTLLPPIAPKYSDPTASPPVSPHHTRRVSNIQDILVFDPTDGILSLRRVVVDQQRPKDQLVMGLQTVSKSTAMGAVSRSLPGSVGSPGRVSVSASPGAISRTSSTSTGGGGGGGGGSGGLSPGEVAMEIAGRGQTVATWSLQRKKDWEQIRKVVVDSAANLGQPREVFGSDWLAQAELSTCSHSPQVLPRSLYLSHQFTFWALGEDYHALLRQYHFDVRGGKIQVRREVQISVGVGLNSTSDHFVDDLDAHRGDPHSSFNEPLASALAGDLGEYASTVPAILPMYPNGVSGTHSSSFIRNSIPIRRLGDGMSEGLGRIRREISTSYHRTMRSPSLGPRRGGGDGDVISVPLEFDEEDEDFLGVVEGDRAGGSGGSAESGALIATPGTSSGTGVHDRVPLAAVPPPPSGSDDIWAGWESREVKQTVEEMEKFDDISVVGFLDEEHQQEREVRGRVEVQQQERAKKGRRRKKLMSQGI